MHNVLTKLKSDLTLAAQELDTIIPSQATNEEFMAATAQLEEVDKFFDCREDDKDEFQECMPFAEEHDNQPLQTSTDNSGESTSRKSTFSSTNCQILAMMTLATASTATVAQSSNTQAMANVKPEAG